jgi:hypothetical protein
MPTDPRTFQLELQALAAGAGRAAAADPLRAGPASRGFQPSRLLFGRVIEGVPYARAYKVQVEGLSTAILCRDLVHTSLVPYGPRQFNTYSPGTLVLVTIHPQMPDGVIVGACPDPAHDPRSGLSDQITQGGRTGVKVDLVNAVPFYLLHGGQVSDFSAGRPADSVGGEWGVMTETGLGLFVDPFQAYLRVDEATGLFVFYHDQLTRLAGVNLQVRSLAREESDQDDEGEVTHERGWAAYVWEAQGRPVPGTWPAQTLTADQSQRQSPHLSRFEPAVADQVAYHRLTELRGYLGQAEAKFLTLPPAASDSAAWPYRRSGVTNPVGVFDEHLSLAGRYTLRSAKGVTIGKTAVVSAPRRKRDASDPTGDRPSTYRPAGVSGGGRAHAVTAEVAAAGLTGLGQLNDQLGYQYNWEGVHPFHYHAADWYLPDVDDDLPQAEAPAYLALATAQYLAPPPFVERDVDHRHSAKYYAAESGIHFADDGSVILFDGSGAELKMSQGSIFLTAPGDVWVQAGKNVNAWAGHDVIAKARNGIDLTTSVGDVRVKGQRTVMVGAGYDGCGGILLESVADAASFAFTTPGEQTRTTGIVLVARRSPVVVAGANVTVTSNWQQYAGAEIYATDADPADTSAGEFGGGGVCVDAGQGNVSVYGDTVRTHVGSAVIDVFADPGGAPAGYVVNEYWRDRATIGTPLDVRGRLLTAGSVVVDGTVFSTGQLVSGGGGVGVLQSAVPVTDAVTASDSRADTMSVYAYNARHEGRAYQENGDILPAKFAFRTSVEYKTTGMLLHEPRWQQQARLTTESLLMFSWYEAEVEGTCPHPGYDAWVTTSAFVTQDCTLYDATDGFVARGAQGGSSPYESPAPPTPTASALSTDYLMLFES